MSYITVRLEDMSIVQIPSGTFHMIPANSIVLGKQLNYVYLEEKKKQNLGLYGYANVSSKDKDPYGLKKPIASSNKKY